MAVNIDPRKHRVDKYNRERDIKPRLIAQQPHEHGKKQACGHERHGVAQMKPHPPLCVIHETVQAEIEKQERADEKNRLRNQAHPGLLHELECIGKIVHRENQENMDHHVHRACCLPVSVDDVIVENFVAQEESRHNQKRHQRKIDGI